MRFIDTCYLLIWGLYSILGRKFGDDQNLSFSIKLRLSLTHLLSFVAFRNAVSSEFRNFQGHQMSH
ncbi:hypothetical protein RND81_03G050400 [Saponaria officinalis]|uniref:Uncharacterized protein n=1 Tax=Saponaria officinalis TaxID=3572 RepID=A0AAW1M4X6_SAPOF